MRRRCTVSIELGKLWLADPSGATAVIPNVKKDTRRGVALENVEKGSIVSDRQTNQLWLTHARWLYDGMVTHARNEWVCYYYRHRVTHSTNQVENLWRHFTAAIVSTYIGVSSEYMDRYLNEFAFRANHRQMRNAMFDLLIAYV